VDAVTAADAEQESVVVDARRQTIERCLDPGRPFTFLDDRLVAAYSLLGVHNMEQTQSVHMKPGQQADILLSRHGSWWIS
jgi:hypothetical protein